MRTILPRYYREKGLCKNGSTTEWAAAPASENSTGLASARASIVQTVPRLLGNAQIFLLGWGLVLYLTLLYETWVLLLAPPCVYLSPSFFRGVTPPLRAVQEPNCRSCHIF